WQVPMSTIVRLSPSRESCPGRRLPARWCLALVGLSCACAAQAGAILPVNLEDAWWWSVGMRVVYAAVAALVFLALLLAWRNKRQEEMHLQRQLRLREDRLRLALWGSGDEFWDWDMQSGMMFRTFADT